VKTIVHQGISYRLESDSFLNEAQALYALEQLWRLVAGTAGWEGAAAVEFKAIRSIDVERMLDSEANSMPWVVLCDVAPAGWASPIDTDRLPVLCSVGNDARGYTGSAHFPLDLVAATFIQLTRWEEWTRPDLDMFGCHKEDSSVAARQGFRDRPVLDEWALVVRAWLKQSHGRWKEQLAPYRVDFSHDIDVLRYYDGPARVARGVARKLFKERLGLACFGALLEGVYALADPERDPCVKAFQTLMEFSESRGTRSTFFFMAAKPGKHDVGYAVDSPLFEAIRDRIRDRGHHLGWHPGFEAAEDDAVFAAELDRYSRAIASSDFGVRHHFLRWRAGYSWRRLAMHSRAFDASVGYNYCVGFRASTAEPYPAFDLMRDVPLQLLVKPLIAMDGPLLRHATPVAEHVALLARRCAAVSGCLSILVHNYSPMYEPGLLSAIAQGLDSARHH